jgi:hypothetical protein
MDQFIAQWVNLALLESRILILGFNDLILCHEILPTYPPDLTMTLTCQQQHLPHTLSHNQ